MHSGIYTGFCRSTELSRYVLHPSVFEIVEITVAAESTNAKTTETKRARKVTDSMKSGLLMVTEVDLTS